MTLTLPDPSLVLLIGSAGAGKSTFAARHFLPTEIISSDQCRALICDDEADQTINEQAFALLHHLAKLRLQQGKFTVIDATNLQYQARRPLLRMARRARIPIVAVVLAVSPSTSQRQNQQRSQRVVPPAILIQHAQELAQAQLRLAREGYWAIYSLTETDTQTCHFVRLPAIQTKQS